VDKGTAAGREAPSSGHRHTQEETVKRFFAALVGIAFVAGLAGAASAQTPATQAPAEKKADDKKMDTKSDAKKASSRTAVGTVKSATDSSLVVAGKAKGKETEWTFDVDPSTKIKKAGKDVTAKDVAAGDKVTVKYTDQGGKMTASNVTVSAPAKAPKTETKKEDKPK
jgi:hypothetical protein